MLFTVSIVNFHLTAMISFLTVSLTFPGILVDMGSATYFGGNDAQEEGHWVWEDGSDFGYTNWAYNEPNGNTSENCLEVNTADGYWNDIDCGGDHFIRYMCESPISKIVNVFIFYPFC